MPVNKSNKFGVQCCVASATKGVRAMWHAGKEVKNMISDSEQASNRNTADKLFAERRELLTGDLHRAMKEETVARESYNRSLRDLRRAERKTKEAAEALGDHTQKQLAL